LGLRTEAKFNCDQQLGVQFGHGAFGVRDKLDKLAEGVARLAFSDAGRHRDGRPPHLGNKPEPFIRWKTAHWFIDELDHR